MRITATPTPAGGIIVDVDIAAARWRVERLPDGTVVEHHYAATGTPMPSPPPASSPSEPCRHRGGKVGRAPCHTCAGAVRVTVFACALHGRCTSRKRVAGAACCAGCGQWSAGQVGGANRSRRGEHRPRGKW